MSLKIATINDIEIIATYLRAMYLEVDEADTLDDLDLFRELATQYISSTIVMFNNMGFFILKDETPIVKKTKIWNGVAVYIKPEFRHTKCLQNFYITMFTLVEGDILGFTHKDSRHNKVLLKRHTLLGYVYKMERN